MIQSTGDDGNRGQLLSPESQLPASHPVGCTTQHHTPAQILPATLHQCRGLGSGTTVSPLVLPLSSIPPAASTPHHPKPWPQGISGASTSREDPGVLGSFKG